MATTQLSSDMAWTTKLHVYDDGLGLTRELGQILRFSKLSEKTKDIERLKNDLREKKTSGTTNLPLDTEKATGSKPKLEGLWVGWYLPLKDLPNPSPKLRGYNVKKLVDGDNAAQSSLVKYFSRDETALKVVCRMNTKEKGMKYYALAYPDPTTGICQAIFIGSFSLVFVHREFRNDTLTSSSSRESESKVLIRAATTRGTENQTAPAATLSSDGGRLLDDVFTHLAEYKATKDTRHVEAVVNLIEEATESDITPWITSDYLQKLVQKKPLSSKTAQKAIEEFFKFYPELSPEDMKGLTDELLSDISCIIAKNPDKYDINWCMLRYFLIALAVNFKENPSDNKAAIEDGVEKAYEIAVMGARTGGSAPSSYQLSENDTLNFVSAEIKFLTRLSATYSGASRALFSFVKSLPGTWGIKQSAKKLSTTTDQATAHVASENFLHALGLKLKIIQDDHLYFPIKARIKELQKLAEELTTKAEEDAAEEDVEMEDAETGDGSENSDESQGSS